MLQIPLAIQTIFVCARSKISSFCDTLVEHIEFVHIDLFNKCVRWGMYVIEYNTCF